MIEWKHDKNDSFYLPSCDEYDWSFYDGKRQAEGDSTSMAHSGEDAVCRIVVRRKCRRMDGNVSVSSQDKAFEFYGWNTIDSFDTECFPGSVYMVK